MQVKLQPLFFAISWILVIFAHVIYSIMGIFGFFNKEKKETLDKGLEKTKTSVFDKLARAVAGKSKVDDDVLDNLEEVLITSDVGVDTTLKIIERIEERVARDKYVSTSELNSILRDEIAKLLAENNSEDNDNWCYFGGWRQWCRQDHNHR